MTAQEDRDAERAAARALLAKEEADHKARMEKGIIEPVFNLKDLKLLDAVVKISAIAKQAARTKVAVKVHDDEGKPTTLEERVAHEEIILTILLNQRLNSMLESEADGR